MSDVFISYSREDKSFVALLREAFLKQEQEVWIDWESIPASQSWWDEIKRGIATANNFMVVMSPNSLSSPICHLEIEHARSLGKRIIPVLHTKPDREACLLGIAKRLANTDSSQDITRDLWGNRQAHTIFDENQKALAPINYFFFTPDDNFNEKFDQLLTIIRADFKHKEIHTRIGLRAGQWASRDRDVSFLLIGEELKDAEAWLGEAQTGDKNPPLTDLQTEYIHAGRETEDKNAQYLRDMEAERHKLADDVASERVKLTDVENARVKLLKRVRFIGIIAGIMLLFAIGASLVGTNAINDATIARNDVATANIQLATATQALATGTAVAQNLADAEATLEVINQQIIVAQATVTQATIVEDIITNFANTILQNIDNPDAQIAQMNILVEQYPYEALVYNIRGLVYRQADKYVEAIADYTQAIALNPQYAEAYNNRGIAYYDLGDTNRAITDYDQAIALNPQYAEAYNNRGIAYYDLGDTNRAITDYTQAITLNPQYAEAYNNRGIAYYDLGDTDRAIADYDQAITLNSQYAEVYFNRGVAYTDLGNTHRAISNYTQAITLNPHHTEAYYNRGVAYSDLGNRDSAIADYTQAITLNPQLVDAYNNRGKAYAYLGEYNNAIADYTQAITLNPRFAAAYSNRAIAYSRLGEYNNAIADYTESINISPRFSITYYNRGIAYSRLGEYDTAIANYTQAIALNPQFAHAYNNRGYSYYLLGDYENALTDCNRALAIGSEYDSYTYMNIGLIYRRLAESASDSETHQEYVALGLENIRIAQSLGYEFNDEDTEALNELQSMLAEITPTPTP